MLDNILLFITGGWGIFFIIMILFLGLWSHFDSKPYIPEIAPSDYDESQKYLTSKIATPVITPKGDMEFREILPTQESIDMTHQHFYGAYSDLELFIHVENQKYGKIIDDSIHWSENELTRRVVYGEIKNETKEEKALFRKIKSLLRGND